MNRNYLQTRLQPRFQKGNQQKYDQLANQRTQEEYQKWSTKKKAVTRAAQLNADDWLAPTVLVPQPQMEEEPAGGAGSFVDPPKAPEFVKK